MRAAWSSAGPAVGFHDDYNGYGYLSQIQSRQGSSAHLAWQATAQDAEQRVTRELLGDGRYTDRRFNVYTGTLDGITAGADNGSGGDDASLENETYLYDAINDLTYRAQRKPDGSLLQENFGYDALNRLVSSQVSGQNQKTYGYDAIGNLTAKSDVGSYSYPASGAGSVRPHAVANIGGSVANQGNSAFAYDANGNLTSGANRSISWTSFDMPASITRTLNGSSGTSVNVALASNGGVATASSELGNGQFPIASIIDGVRGAPNWTQGGVGSGWNDATNNVYPDWVEVDFAGSQTIGEIDVFTYDQNNGNATIALSTIASDGQISDFAVQYWGGSNWVTVPGGNVTGNHNLWRQFTFAPITTTKIRITVYNAQNNTSPYLFSRITEVEAWTAPIPASSNTANFVYGPEHQRIRQTVTGTNPITIYYAGAIEKEVTGSGTTVKTRMPRGVGYVNEASGDVVRYRYLRGDHLGSSVILTDDAGNVIDRDSYDAWGQRRNTDGSDDATYSLKGADRTGYTGEEMLDTIGLVHLNGRVYDPLVGRFVSADPLVGGDASSQLTNRYSYVSNNPLNFSDPTGYEEEEKKPPPPPPPPPPLPCRGLDCYKSDGTQVIYDYHWFYGGYQALRAVADQHTPLILTAEASIGILSDAAPISLYTGSCNGHECPNTLEEELKSARTHEFSVLDLPSFIPYVGGPYAIVRGAITRSASTIAFGIAATVIDFSATPIAGEIFRAARVGGIAAKTAGQLGREGETAVRAVYDLGEKPTQSILMNGRARRPDGLTNDVLSEVKNVDRLSFTRQLRDYSDYSALTGRSFDLYTRSDTKLSGPLQDAIDSGLINHFFIP